MSEHESIWQRISEWWHLLWHHAQAGTLPPAPVPGGVPVTIPPIGGTVTPPAPPLPVLPAGVTLVDTVNGLVKIDAAESVWPGQLWACLPTLAALATGSQAWATVNYNTAAAKAANNGLGLHSRVNTMVPAKNADGTDGWKNSDPFVWIDNAWSIGAEFSTWDAVTAQAVAVATRGAHPNAGGGGFVPGH